MCISEDVASMLLRTSRFFVFSLERSSRSFSVSAMETLSSAASAIFCFFSVAIVSMSSSEVIGKLEGRSFFFFVGGRAGRTFDRGFFLLESFSTTDGWADLLLCFTGDVSLHEVLSLVSLLEEDFPVGVVG